MSWLPHGKAFKIRSKKEFESLILPQYFEVKPRSFQRQLALYGFENVKNQLSPDVGAYRHPLMRRGQPALCQQMRRQKIKNTMKRGGGQGDLEVLAHHYHQSQEHASSTEALASLPLVSSDNYNASPYQGQILFSAPFSLAGTTGALCATSTIPCNALPPANVASFLDLSSCILQKSNEAPTNTSSSRGPSFQEQDEDLLRFAVVANQLLDQQEENSIAPTIALVEDCLWTAPC